MTLPSDVVALVTVLSLLVGIPVSWFGYRRSRQLLVADQKTEAARQAGVVYNTLAGALDQLREENARMNVARAADAERSRRRETELERRIEVQEARGKQRDLKLREATGKVEELHAELELMHAELGSLTESRDTLAVELETEKTKATRLEARVFQLEETLRERSIPIPEPPDPGELP